MGGCDIDLDTILIFVRRVHHSRNVYLLSQAVRRKRGPSETREHNPTRCGTFVGILELLYDSYTASP